MARGKIHDTEQRYRQQFARARSDLDNTTNWNNLLRQQLEQALVTIDAITQENNEYKLKLAEKSNVMGELQGLSEGDGNTLKDGSSSGSPMKDKVAELERALAEMEKAHEKEREEHKTALINAANQIVGKQMTIDRLEKMQVTQAAQDMGSSEVSAQVLSPKRDRSCEKVEENLQDQPIKKRRQRRRGVGPDLRVTTNRATE